MLIQEEITLKSGKIRIKSYSDAGKFIRQTESKCLYHVAVDVPNMYTYEETDIDIPTPPNSDEEV